MLQILLIAHLILIAMGTGMAFSNFVNLRLADGATGEAAKAFARQRMTIARFADMVIGLIWITGLALLWTRAAGGLERALCVALAGRRDRGGKRCGGLDAFTCAGLA